MTALQIKTLRTIAAGGVSMVKAGYAAFRVHGGSPTVVGRLVSAGLARWPKGAVGEQTCELTLQGQMVIDEAAQ